MANVKNSIGYGKGKSYSLEALAFRLGAHGNDPVPVKEEIQAKFVQETLKEKQEPLRKLKELEARVQTVRKERPEAEEVWQQVRQQLGDTPPPYVHALIMALFGLFAFIVDVLVLAPSMDMIAVSDPAFQYLAAAGFASLFTISFERIGVSYLEARTILQKRAAIAVGALVVLGLVAWGLLRGNQLQFVAGMNNGPLGDFLAEHPILSATFFIFATLATPVIGAVSLFHARHEIRNARTWRQARRRFEELRTAEVELPKQVEVETELLNHIDRRREAECREWHESFNHYYDRGRKNGARQEPLWSVLWKSLLGLLIGSLADVMIPKTSLLLWLLLPAIPGLGMFLILNHRRLHPSPEHYITRENTKFTTHPGSWNVEGATATAPRLLSKEIGNEAD